jgi:cytochrome c
MRSVALCGLALCIAACAPESGPEDPKGPGLGTPISEEEVDRYTVFPDGRNLPEGSGSVAEGKLVYDGTCAACHGETGREGPSARLVGPDGFFTEEDGKGPVRMQDNPLLVLSVGAQWPYATSIFDYVRRAMPHRSPKSLTDSQVYAVTAYILYLNRLLPADGLLDRQSLVTVVMPGRARGADSRP